MSKWHSGPPPSVGWWPAKLEYESNSENIRWWNGEQWSIQFWRGDDGAVRAMYAAERCNISPYTDRVEWKHRPESWPSRSKT